MPDVSLETIVEDLRALAPDDQRRVRDLLDSWLEHTAELPLADREKEVQRRLEAKGLLKPRELANAGGVAPRRRQPLDVPGEPVSQTIIRERR